MMERVPFSVEHVQRAACRSGEASVPVPRGPPRATSLCHTPAWVLLDQPPLAAPFLTSHTGSPHQVVLVSNPLTLPQRRPKRDRAWVQTVHGTLTLPNIYAQKPFFLLQNPRFGLQFKGF